MGGKGSGRKARVTVVPPGPPEQKQPRRHNAPAGWQERFLEALKNSGNIRASAERASITRYYVYEYRNKHPEFKEAMEQAMQDAIDVLQAVAWQRARDLSDTLLIFLLKSHRPEVYGDRVRLDVIKQEAERLAEGSGFTADELISQAEEILRRNGVH